MAGLEHLPPRPRPPERPPRASLLLAPGEDPPSHANLWIGGAHADQGEDIPMARLASAWVLDLAGDMPPDFRTSALRWQTFVFPDVESVPPRFDRLLHIVREFAVALRSPGPPADVFLMCQYGYNRSGLAAGLLLRELGFDPHAAVALVRARRPGALANAAFSDLILRSQ